MRPLSYARVADVDTAIATVTRSRGSAFLAGGTTEVDLLRQDVLKPTLLVDINDLPLKGIEELPGGGLRIGALARMSDVAQTPAVRRRFPVISQALLLGASGQMLPLIHSRISASSPACPSRSNATADMICPGVQ